MQTDSINYRAGQVVVGGQLAVGGHLEGPQHPQQLDRLELLAGGRPPATGG